MNYWLHPEAREDLREAASFYRDNAGVALSQALLAKFEHPIGLLLKHPRLGGRWLQGKRRYLMRRFPFSIIYALSGEQLRVLAVAHQSRRPGYWRGRK